MPFLRSARFFVSLSTLILQWGCDLPKDHLSDSTPGSVLESASQTYPIQIADYTNQVHLFLEAPSRIISLVPSATETLLSIDVENSLVGRTDFDDAPGISHLPSVGTGLNPDLEILLSLEPDLIIAFAGESDPSIMKHLRNAGTIPFMIRPDKLEDATGIIETLSLITDREHMGDSIIETINSSLEMVRKRVENQPKPRVAYILGGEPPWVTGPDTYLHQLIAVSGGQNIFEDLEHEYVPVSLEEFFIRKPDLILSTEHTYIPKILQNSRTIKLSSSIEIPGPGLAEAILEIARAIHPKIFP